MNQGIRNPLISMLYLAILIIAKEDLLTGTRAPIKITMATIGATAKVIDPGKAAADNQCVITVQGCIT